jgi:hypothetical protein
MLYFGRRGRENLRNLKVDDFQVGIQQGGGDVEHRFVYIQRDEVFFTQKSVDAVPGVC